MHRINGAQWDREVTGVLDVDYKFGPAAWRNLANGTKLLGSVGSEHLKSCFDFFLHDVFLHCAPGRTTNSLPQSRASAEISLESNWAFRGARLRSWSIAQRRNLRLVSHTKSRSMKTHSHVQLIE